MATIDEVVAPAAGAGVADPPWAYIPRDRRRALASGRALPTRVTGSALFADISGFTPVTEALANELGSQRASEVLTGHLNRVFHAVIAELDRFSGDVVYFSGDAITCWLDGDDGVNAVAAGFGMQQAIEREGEIVTPGGAVFQLGLKVAVAVGEARRFVVGDPDIQLIEVLAGSLIDRLAVAEGHAEKGQVVLDAISATALAGKVAFRDEERGVVEQVLAQSNPVVELDEAALPDELSRSWLLPAVYERLATGRGEFLAELRPAFPVFVNFGGIDYDDDERAPEKLDEFVRSAQRILSSYGGNVLQLTLGDKGAYLYGVFGTPFAHEDDAARACAAVLALRDLEQTTAAGDIRTGVTHGRLRSGTYGHTGRRTFVCLGDAVNLSARLMSKAPSGEIYVSELVRRMAGTGFSWQKLEPLTLKGKASPVAAYALTGSTGPRSRRVTRYTLPIVGRDSELAWLDAGLADASAGRGRILGIAAEAGMGKSRLLAEFVRDARRRGQLVAFGECQSFGTRTTYAVWEEIWRALLAVPETMTETEQLVALEQSLTEIDPALLERAPLLDAILGLPIRDTELTASFDAKLRKTSLESLLADCLRTLARTDTNVIVLEDCHWLDPLSRDLLDVLARAVDGSHLLLVLAYRPEGLGVSGLAGLEEVALDTLGEAEMTEVVRGKLGQLVGEGAEVPRSLLEVVVERSQGNPFYAEELLNYVDELEVDLADESALRSLELPGSLHSLVLGRIDTLSESPRRTLKVASVAGRVFRAPVISGAYPELGSSSDIRAHLLTLKTLDLVNVDRESDESYLFKHAVTHEVAYESLPYALRATLHGDIGRFLEEFEPVERNLDLLAHHFWHSDDDVRKRLYLRRAGDAAQAIYANQAAIDYYERLAPMLPEAERAAVLLELGKVLALVGRWDDARRVGTDALELAASIGDTSSAAWCETALGEVARKQGLFDEANERLERARAAFAELHELEGVGRVLQLEGTLAAQRGDIGAARERYEASLEIREGIGDRAGIAALLNNLGIMAEWDGDYGRGLAFHERAYELLSELGDRAAIASSMMNIGMNAMYRGRADDALEPFQEAMRLNREVGDRWEVALAHHNLANAARALGDYPESRTHYSESIGIYREFGDRWALALLIEDVALLASSTADRARALWLIGSAESLRDEIGSPRAPSLQEELDGQLASSRAQLGEAEADAAIASGRALDADGAVALALEVARGPEHSEPQADAATAT
jgi:class 3 adenylate cyclase/tetratricopeptide (TPR) repeat protein